MSILTSARRTADQTLQAAHKKAFRFWTGRMLLGLGITLVALSAFGARYQAFATANDRRQFPPPGQLVDVGGYRLHLFTMGADHGGPTVILDAALGFSSSAWAWVQPDVAQFARVVAYDRPGLGWSDSGPHPRSFHRNAAELHTALHNAGIPGPYVLVGHSLGGLFVRAFADQYPNEVAGMVLVDASHPDQFVRLASGPQLKRTITTMTTVGPILARLGLLRVVDRAQFSQAGGLPPQARAALNAVLATTQHWDASRAEVTAWEALNTSEVLPARSLGDRPLMVLTAGQSDATIPGVYALQDEIAHLSSNSTHSIVRGATHAGIVTDQVSAAQVVEAVRQVLEAARTGQPLER